MNVASLSDDRLSELHARIRRCLDDDDGLPAGPKKFEIRENPVWREQADVLEAELRRRNMEYVPVKW